MVRPNTSPWPKRLGAVGLSLALTTTMTPLAFAEEFKDSAAGQGDAAASVVVDDASTDGLSGELLDEGDIASGGEEADGSLSDVVQGKDQKDADAPAVTQEAGEASSESVSLMSASANSVTEGTFSNFTWRLDAASRTLTFVPNEGATELTGSYNGTQEAWISAVKELPAGSINVVFENGPTSIESYFFTGLDSSYPVNLTIPESVTSFDSSSVNKGMVFSSISDSSVSANGMLFAMSGPWKCVVASSVTSGDVVIPEGIQRVNASVFKGSSYGTLVLPASMNRWKGQEFSNTDVSIDKIVLAEGITSKLTLDSAGNLCSEGTIVQKVNAASSEYFDSYGVQYSSDHKTLQKVVDPSKLPASYTIDPLCTEINSSAFDGCVKLESVTGESVKKVWGSAFSGCSSLTSVNLPSVEQIESFAFDGSGLVSFVAPETLSSLGSAAFANCSALTSVDLSQSKISEIGERMFTGCVNLANLPKLPSSVESIGASAFENAGLKSVDLSDTQIVSLGSKSFNGCTSLASIALPSTLTSVGDAVFQGTALASADLSNTQLASLSNNLFANCTALQTVKLPNTLTDLGSYTFAGCTSMTSFTVPQSVTKLGNLVFQSCSNLTEVNLHDGVAEMGIGVFAGTSIVTFTTPAGLWAGRPNNFSKDSAGVWGSAALFTNTAAASLGNLSGAVSEESVWSKVSSIDLTKYSNKYIPAMMFMGLRDMQTVTIPSNIEIIDSMAFFGCTGLESVYCFNQNVRVAGAGTTGDSELGWTADTYPAFSAWYGVGSDAKVRSIDGLKLYGLAYSSNDLIEYAQTNNCTFVPFVVLDNVDTQALFGNEVYGYNNIVVDDMVYTGKELTPQVRVEFTDMGGIAPRTLTSADADVVFKDAGGNTVTSIVAAGTYTAEITGKADAGVFGTKTVSFKVVDPNGNSGQGGNGNQNTNVPPANQQVNAVQQAGNQAAGGQLAQTDDPLTRSAAPLVATGVVGAFAATLIAFKRRLFD